jgi:hypothetical protein
VEDIERKVVFASCGMLVLVHVVCQERVQCDLLLRDRRVFVLEEVCPCGIDGWAWFAEVKREGRVNLSVYRVARLVEEEEVVKFDRCVFV